MRPTLSVVVPMYNEAAVVPQLLLESHAALAAVDAPYELVCVDDGSTDDTAAQVQAAAEQWPELRLVRLLRNSGHQAALSAGYERARGDFVVTMDADLQDPPSVVCEMLRVAREQGVDVVYGVRRERSSDGFAKRRTARLYYALMRRVAGEQVPADVGDFRLVSRRVVEALERVPAHNRVYRLMIPWYGFPSAEVGYVRPARAAGRTKYPPGKMIALAVDSVTAFSAAPLRVATFLGLIGVAVSLLSMVVSVVAWATDNTVPGWTSIVATVGLIGAIQLVCVGLLGEYMARLFIASQARPTYVVGYDSVEDPAASPVSAPGRTTTTPAGS